MSTQFEKNLIVNGSLNTTITLEEILEHYGDNNSLTIAAWNICVELNVYHKAGNLPSYEEICANPKDHLIAIWERNTQAKELAKAEAHKEQFEEGKKIAEFIKSMPNRSTTATFSNPSFPMSPSQALGYLSVDSGFNNYNPLEVTKAFRKIESLGIRQDYGLNNPNTGKENTTYTREGDYWFVSFEVSENKQEEFLQKWGAQIETALRGAGADSIRIERRQFDLFFVSWWD